MEQNDQKPEETSADPQEKPALALGSMELGLAARGDLRWAAVDLSKIMEAARLRLDLSPLATTALGRALASVALLQGLAIRTPRRMVLEIRGDGPIAQLVAEIDQEGNLRGSVAFPQIDLPPRSDGQPAVGEAVGKGLLRVLRQAPDGSTYQSEVELKSGEIGLDLAHYLEQSEQTQSGVLVGVLTGPEGVRSAGGLIVEALPGTPDETLAALEANLAGIGGVSAVLAEQGIQGLIRQAFDGLDPELHEEHAVAYRCRCNREVLRLHLAAIAAAEEEGLANAEGQIAVDCVFCGETYLFESGEVEIH